MKISVIVPVYNTATYVDRCMQALLAQDYPRDDYEIIAVDNGSSDDSRERLAQYPVTRVDEARRGSYAARNAGVRVANGQIFAFTDSDCAPCPEWLRVIEDALQQPDCLVVQGKRVAFSDSVLLQAINRYEYTKDAYVLAGDRPLMFYGYTNNMGMRRETYERYGPFVERDRGADTMFVRSVVDGESCRAVAYAPEMVVNHLEMNGYVDYLKKMFIYGRSRKRYRKLMKTRPLALSDRLQVLRRTVDTGGYSSWRIAMLCGGLALGMAAWQLGSWTGSVETPDEADR